MAKKRRKKAGSEKRPDKRGGRNSPSASDVPDADLGPAIPLWVPAAAFVSLTFLLFREFVFSDQMLYGGDTLVGPGYVARAFYADALASLGSVPGWAPLLLGGTPFIEALAGGDSLYPPSVLLLMLLDTHRALGWKLVLHFAAAGFFMFGWLRAIGRSRAASLLGSVAYMLAPYFVSLVYPGHDGKIFVTALAPLLFWAVERHFLVPRFKTVASIALVIGLVILTTHFQMAYFLFGAVGMYAIFRSWEIWAASETAGSSEDKGPDDEAARPEFVADGEPERDGEPAVGPSVARAGRSARVGLVPFALFLGASLLGAGVASVQLIPAVEYVREYSRRVQTTRDAMGETGAAWSSSWSLHPEDVVGMVIPEFSGNESRGAEWSNGTYWGRNPTKDNHESTGLVILLLAAVAFAGGARKRMRFFFLGLGALALLFGLGIHTPVWRFFFAVVPGISLFRAPGQVMFLFAFSAGTLGAIGLDRLLRLGRSENDKAWGAVMKTLTVAVGCLAVLALLAGSGALTSFWTAALHQPPRPEALQALEPYIARGALYSLFFGIATWAAAWGLRDHHLAPAGIVAALVILVAADEFRISHGFIQPFDFHSWSAPDGFVQAIRQREGDPSDPYRLLSFRRLGQDVQPALHGIELAAGHHPNDLSRYRELIGMVGSGIPMNLLQDVDIRRLLNVRYVLWDDFRFQAPFGPPQSVVARRPLADGTPYETLHVEADLPRARLVGSSVVKTDEAAVQYMLSDAFDPELEVVLAEASPISLDGEPSQGTVTWVERTPDHLELMVRSERPALLVVADNWFPAWRATVGGVDASVLRAYHTLRAVPVPAGEHTVRMWYRSDLVTRSLWLSLFLSVVLLGALIASAVRERRPRRVSP